MVTRTVTAATGVGIPQSPAAADLTKVPSEKWNLYPRKPIHWRDKD